VNTFLNSGMGKGGGMGPGAGLMLGAGGPVMDHLATRLRWIDEDKGGARQPSAKVRDDVVRSGFAALEVSNKRFVGPPRCRGGMVGRRWSGRRTSPTAR
jgi:hypothetical protein